MFETARAVEIRGTSEGSGFLVGPGLILTAWHVLRPPEGAPLPSRVQVRILRDYGDAAPADRLRTRDAELLWPLAPPDDDNDFALLRLCALNAGEAQEAAVAWSELPDGDALAVRIVGFPDFAIFSRIDAADGQAVRERDAEAVDGEVQAGSGWKQRRVYDQGTFDVLMDAKVQPEGTHLAWQGISGAAVFAGPVLVGVVRLAVERGAGRQRLQALPVSRLLGKAGVQAALRAAGVALPPRTTLQATGRASPGFTSDLLDHFGVARGAPSEFRAGVERFIGSYLGPADRPVAFGGREDAIERLDGWLADAAASPRLLLHAPGGQGKSALLVHWLLEAATRCRLVFLPISVRNGTNLELAFFHALAARLAELAGTPLAPPSTGDPVGHYRGQSIALMRNLGAGALPVLFVIDGLDEAAGWEPPIALLPELPHPGLRVVVSAREGGDLRDANAWLRKLGWDMDQPRPVTELVAGLDVGGVVQVLHSAGLRLDDAGSRALATQVRRLSDGAPWIVRLYAEDLVGSKHQPQRLDPETLAGLEPGFGPFFRGWLADQKALWARQQRPLDEAALEALLALLATALGPLRHDDLAELYRRYRGSDGSLSSDALEPIARFIQGDGRAAGYVLTHPKLADFLRNEHFTDALVVQRARAAYLRWGADTLAVLDAAAPGQGACPAYLVRYLGQHLVEANAPAETFMALVERGWMAAWRAAEGGFRGFAMDVRRAAEAIEKRARQDERRWAWRLRCQLTTSAIASVGARIPGLLLAACVEAGRLTGRQGLYWLEQGVLLPTPGGILREIDADMQRSRAFVALAKAWPVGEDRSAGLRELLRVLALVPSESARLDALAGVGALWPDELVDEALEVAMTTAYDKARAPVVAALLPRTSASARAKALRAHLLGAGAREAGATAEALAASLTREELALVFEQARALVAGDRNADRLARLLVAEMARDPQAAAAVLARAVAVAAEPDRGALIVALTPGLPDALLGDALDATLAMRDAQARWTALSGLAPRLSAQHLDIALRNVRTWTAPVQQASALGEIAKRLEDAATRAAVVGEALAAIDTLGDDMNAVFLLPSLAAMVDDEDTRGRILARWLRGVEAKPVPRDRALAIEFAGVDLPAPLLAQALRLVAALDDEFSRSSVLIKLAPTLPASLMPQALAIARSLRREFRLGEVIVALAPRLPDELVPEVLQLAGGIVDMGGAPALAALVDRLPPALLGEALAMALRAVGADARDRVVGLVVARIPEPTLENLLRTLLTDEGGGPDWSSLEALGAVLGEPLLAVLMDMLLAAGIDNGSEAQRVLVAIVPRLPAPLLERALQAARTFKFPSMRARALVAVGVRLGSGGPREQVFGEVLAALDDAKSSYDSAEVLERMLPLLAPGEMEVTLARIEVLDIPINRATLLQQIADALPPGLVARAWRAAQGIAEPDLRAQALARLAPRFPPGDARADALAEALRGFMTIGDEGQLACTIAAVVPLIADAPARQRAIDEGLRLAAAPHDVALRLVAFAHLAPWREDALDALLRTGGRWEWAQNVAALLPLLVRVDRAALLRALARLPDTAQQRDILLVLARALPEAEREPVLRLGLDIADEGHRADFLRDAAPLFGPVLIGVAVRRARQMDSAFQRNWALQGLGPHRPRTLWDRLLRRREPVDPVAHAAAALARAATLREVDRTGVIRDIAPTLPPSLAAEALRICASIRNLWWRKSALLALAPHLPADLLAQALDQAADIVTSNERGEAIGALAAFLPPALVGRALDLVEANGDYGGLAAGIAGLAPVLDAAQRARAIAFASARLASGEYRVRALSALGAQLPPGPEREALFADILAAAEAIGQPVDRLRALRHLLPHLAGPAQEQAVLQLLVAGGGQPRASLLEAIPVLAERVAGYRTPQAATAVAQALHDVGAWFP